MHRIAVILLVLVGLTVAGCDHVAKVASDVGRSMLVSDLGRTIEAALPHHPISIVLPPGYPVALDGKKALVFGNNDCLGGDPMMDALFGPDPYAGKSSCVVLAPDTQFVTVTLVDPKEHTLTREVWDVVRGGERRDAITLRRQDGSFVVSHEALDKAEKRKKPVLGMI